MDISSLKELLEALAEAVETRDAARRDSTRKALRDHLRPLRVGLFGPLRFGVGTVSDALAFTPVGDLSSARVRRLLKEIQWLAGDDPSFEQKNRMRQVLLAEGFCLHPTLEEEVK